MINQNITPMSEATYTRGMREIVDKGFIAATPHIGIFWLNPDYVWNGDRLAFVKEYYKKSAEPYPKFESETIENNINPSDMKDIYQKSFYPNNPEIDSKIRTDIEKYENSIPQSN